MKVILSLFAVFCALFADEVAQNKVDSANIAESSKVAESAPVVADPDAKLKNDIVGFERDKYFQGNAKIDDPFLYVYPISEDYDARKKAMAQTLLTLRSIVVSPDSADGAEKYMAHINDKWVKECKVPEKKQDCDYVDGWRVVKISEGEVQLSADGYGLKKDLKIVPKRIEMTKTEVQYK